MLSYNSKNLGISAHSVGHILSSCGIEVKNGGQNKRPVGQFTKQGEFIQEFESQEQGALYLIQNGKTSASLNTVRGHIGQCCAGKEKSSYGFIWKWL